MGTLGDISLVMDMAQKNMSSGEFMRAVSFLSDSKAKAREALQKITSDKIKNTIRKLEKNSPLTDEDVQCMELWIIGDAESYIEMENNLEDWLKEFNRIRGVLQNFENKDLSVDELFKLQGILEDAVRVCADIGNFLEKKERIQSFKNSTKDIANLDKDIIIKILIDKLKSSEF